MSEHAGAIEADLFRYYGIDMLDFHRGMLSARRLRVLVEHLPRDSALARELYGDEAGWGLSEHLLATAVDHLAAGNWMFAAVHAPEHADPPERPKPVPRPGMEMEESGTPSASTEQIAAFFGVSNPTTDSPAARATSRPRQGAR